MGIHDGHRKRVKEKFIEFGLDSFSDVEVLEFLLFFAVPRKDTNEIAHHLLNQFGSLHGVFNASYYELLEVPGITVNSAILITFISRLQRKIEISKTKSIRIIKNSKDSSAYLIPRFKNEQEEVMLLLCLDAKRSVICCKELGRGTAVSVDIDCRKVAETALKVNAVTAIIAHNHPGGKLYPSVEDDSLTQILYKALRNVEIKLEDHLIIVDDEYVSYADAGAMNLLRY